MADKRLDDALFDLLSEMRGVGMSLFRHYDYLDPDGQKRSRNALVEQVHQVSTLAQKASVVAELAGREPHHKAALEVTEELLSAAYSRGLLEEIGALQDADMAGHMQKGVDEMDRVIDLEAASGLLGIKPSTLHTHLRRRREAGKLLPFVKMSHPRGQKYMTTVGELRQWAKVELGRDLA